MIKVLNQVESMAQVAKYAMGQETYAGLGGGLAISACKIIGTVLGSGGSSRTVLGRGADEQICDFFAYFLLFTRNCHYGSIL